MAQLTAAVRERMPAGKFAGPGKSFPVNDATHQRLAIGGATRAYRAGNISASEKDRIQRIARSLLRKSHGSAP